MGRRTLASFLACALVAGTVSCDSIEKEARRELRLTSQLAAEERPDGAAPAPAERPAPPRPRDQAPPIIRGIYVSAYAIGSPVKRAELLALADSTEINTFVVDVKDEDGVRHPSQVAVARQAAHERSIPVRDLKGIVDTLRAHGIYPIARVVVFKDPRLSRLKPEWSIRNPDGTIWRDKQGLSWVSPWDRNVWEMNIAVAEEAVRAGFREIQFDYVRFPEQYKSLPTQVHPAADSAGNRTDAIAGFLAAARARLHPLGATVTADVFGLSMNESRDVGIGQQWERISALTDGILPMVYPSHYFPTHLAGIHRPNRMPYETVHTSVGMGVIRADRMRAAGVEPARIVPWLQAFTATWNDR
ncbi:MAG TPA: putative glycoside hydrolase, partial [Longimicrobium sp.]|nr:putative glycoside hydrolase [Longimicrobium sp.]